mgnify:CR=1 FL=1
MLKLSEEESAKFTSNVPLYSGYADPDTLTHRTILETIPADENGKDANGILAMFPVDWIVKEADCMYQETAQSKAYPCKTVAAPTDAVLYPADQLTVDGEDK